MNRDRWQFLFALALIGLSILLYGIELLLVKNPKIIFESFIGSLAFAPIWVLVVTLTIEEMMNQRDKRAMLSKLNMIIGVFFSQTGDDLLRFFIRLDPERERLQKLMTVRDTWTEREFGGLRQSMRNYEPHVSLTRDDLVPLKAMMSANRDMLLRLMENPNLLENEAFTELLRAVFHLEDELSHRTELYDLPDSDVAHLSLDGNRAYGLLVREWVEYMRYLKTSYPYLFSLAIRVNPFAEAPSAIVK